MCGKAFEPDLIVGWPTAEISVMGPEGMLGIAAKKMFGDTPPPPEVKQAIVESNSKEHRHHQGCRLGPHRRCHRSARHEARARLGP